MEVVSRDPCSASSGLGSAGQLYHPLLKFVRHRLNRPGEADDIVQDAFARLIMAQSLQDIRDPPAFLRAAALNVIRSRARADSVRRVVHSDCDRDCVASDAPSIERVIEGRQQMAVLKSAMAELTPKRRAALILSRLEGIPQRTIATRLGLSLSMVEKHIRFALEHCRRRVAEANGEDPNLASGK